MKYRQLNFLDEKVKIILTLKQEYFEKIISGKKKNEYRFNIPKDDVEAYVYLPSPHKKIVGLIELKNTRWMDKETISHFYENNGDGDFKTMYDWIGNKIGCYVSEICSVIQFKEVLRLDFLRKEYNFYAPQSWMYLNKNEKLDTYLSIIKKKNIEREESND